MAHYPFGANGFLANLATADLYAISRATLYRLLRGERRPRDAHRGDRGTPRDVPAAEIERWCEIFAAMKVRTTNRKGRHLSTVGRHDPAMGYVKRNPLTKGRNADWQTDELQGIGEVLCRSFHDAQPHGRYLVRSMEEQFAEVTMKLIQAAALLALIASPLALAAENTTPPIKNVLPGAQNSGAGITGQPGGKNGPATNAQGQVANSDQTNSTTRLQDTAKIPGKAGGKSGPAVTPTSQSGQKP